MLLEVGLGPRVGLHVARVWLPCTCVWRRSRTPSGPLVL
jgi:hypothetical protein